MTPSTLYRDLKAAFTVIFIVLLVLAIVDYTMGGGPFDWAYWRDHFLINFYYGLPLSLANGWFFDYLNRKIPWDQYPRRRVLVGISGMLALTMGLLVVLNFFLWSVFYGNEVDALWAVRNRSFYLIALVITVIVTISIHAMGFYNEGQRQRLLNAQLQQEKLSGELGALRAQVDPHFLFNSFNVLSGLIDEDPAKAQEFLAGLSAIYRYVLEQRNESVSTLAEELAFARQYMHLQQTRFENSIRLETDISPASLSRELPSLSLQLLLENAIKHNRFDSEHPLRIRIEDRGGRLLVSNSRCRRNSLPNGSRLGLQNIKDRYRLLQADEPIVSTESNQFTVQLPLL